MGQRHFSPWKIAPFGDIRDWRMLVPSHQSSEEARSRYNCLQIRCFCFRIWFWSFFHFFPAGPVIKKKKNHFSEGNCILSQKFPFYLWNCCCGHHRTRWSLSGAVGPSDPPVWSQNSENEEQDWENLWKNSPGLAYWKEEMTFCKGNSSGWSFCLTFVFGERIMKNNQPMPWVIWNQGSDQDKHRVR